MRSKKIFTLFFLFFDWIKKIKKSVRDPESPDFLGPKSGFLGGPDRPCGGGFFCPKKSPWDSAWRFSPPTIGGSPRKIPWPRWLPPGISKIDFLDGTIIEKKWGPDPVFGRFWTPKMSILGPPRKSIFGPPQKCHFWTVPDRPKILSVPNLLSRILDFFDPQKIDFLEVQKNGFLGGPGPPKNVKFWAEGPPGRKNTRCPFYYSE